ncbi:hypothetical protein [Rhodanobacter glycinis]|uniref:hypothetical protein n=1 Tax=Rhodanobacter glycinis TaxID=582702 RepID=UPI001126264B|nr:hypothetical protein [Rhodanobacter glycinis]
MKQRISTTCDSDPGIPLDEVPTGVDTVCSIGPARSDAGLSWVAYPGAQLDEVTNEITPKARAAMSAACEFEAEHWSISPFDEGGYSTFFEPVPAMLTVLRMAVQVEPHPVEAGFWYQRTRIAELDGLTAAQLVSLGRADDVIRFLLSIRDGARD